MSTTSTVGVTLSESTPIGLARLWQLQHHTQELSNDDRPISEGDTILEQEKITLKELEQLNPEQGIRSRAFVVCSDCGEPIVDETLGSFMGGTRWVHAKHLQDKRKRHIHHSGAAIG